MQSLQRNTARRWLVEKATRLYGLVLRRLYGGSIAGVFDADFYRTEYPEIVPAGFDPLAHFFLFGARERRQPHALFDTNFYVSAYPDVLASGRNPLLHYLQDGWKEDRYPNAIFRPGAYRKEHSLRTDQNPFLHLLAELNSGQQIRLAIDLKEYAPPIQSAAADEADVHGVVDVIVRGSAPLEQTRACLESVLTARTRTPFELIVIGDGPIGLELDGYVPSAAADGPRILNCSDARGGYAVARRRAIALHPDRDIILLDGGSIVSGDWIDRLANAAYADDRTATATPFTNSGGMGGFPRLYENPLPLDVAAQDSVVRAANKGIRVDTPISREFCMYVRRRCIEALGGFEGTQDFFDRARANGWRHVLATDVFIGHLGPVEHVPTEEDPARARRVAALAYRMKSAGKPVVLAITHRLGGGVDEHLKNLKDVVDGAEFLMLQPAIRGFTALTSLKRPDEITIWIDNREGEHKVAQLLASFGVSRVHVHHEKDHGLDIKALIRDLDVPFDFTIHDYFTACPQVTMTDSGGRYCGEPDPSSCNECIRERPCGPPDILGWRDSHGWLSRTASRVIAPSYDAAERFTRYFPGANTVVAPHPETGVELQPVMIGIGPEESLRIAVLGSMVPHKGLKNLWKCASLAQRNKLPLTFTLVGEAVGQRNPPFRQTGRYHNGELGAILRELKPHMVWFPGQAPETYSFTLSECLRHALPVVAPRIGCFPERLGGRPFTWLAPHDWAPKEWIAFFMAVRSGDRQQSLAAEHLPLRDRGNAGFYRSEYIILPQDPLKDSQAGSLVRITSK